MRFQIIGEFWAMVETEREYPLVNISRGGALIRSSVPVAVGTIHKVRLVTPVDTTLVDVEVRHVTRTVSEHTACYMLGVEFVRVSEEARRRIAMLVGDAESLG